MGSAEPLQPDPGSEDDLVLETLASAEQLGGLYSDFARISHDEHGFMIDFFATDKSNETEPRAILQSRIRLSHRHGVALSRALADNVEKWALKELGARERENESLEELAKGRQKRGNDE